MKKNIITERLIRWGATVGIASQFDPEAEGYVNTMLRLHLQGEKFWDWADKNVCDYLLKVGKNFSATFAIKDDDHGGKEHYASFTFNHFVDSGEFTRVKCKSIEPGWWIVGFPCQDPDNGRTFINCSIMDEMDWKKFKDDTYNAERAGLSMNDFLTALRRPK